MSYTPNGLVPIGGIVAWHKSFTNTPSLLGGYLEVNGQTVSDAGSPYNGQTLPDVNSATPSVLRGNTASGGTGGSDTHIHSVSTTTPAAVSVNTGGTVTINAMGAGAVCGVTDPQPNIPVYMSVVWVIRVRY